jgi:hypothetical protein
MKNEEQKTLIELPVCNTNRCPDYDEDCLKVKNYLLCYMGHPPVWNGIEFIEMDRAKGYCPFIHGTN